MTPRVDTDRNHPPEMALQPQAVDASVAVPSLEWCEAAVAPDWAEVAHPRPYICVVTPPSGAASRAIPHVNNIEYLRWVDRIAELHARHLGLSREELLAKQRMWFVARHELDYLAETWPGEEIHVATWVQTVGRTRSWRRTVAWRNSDRRRVLRASTCWVLVDILSRRPVRIEPEWAARLDPE